MLVAVTGASGVLGRSAVRALVAAGHEVRGLSRSEAGDAVVRELGGHPVRGDLSGAGLDGLVAGCGAVANLATSIPVGLRGFLPGAWRANTALRTEGVRQVLVAAGRAGVDRVVQESVTFAYADAGDDWVEETSPLDISAAIEPSVVAESAVQAYARGARTGIVLRFGQITGDDAMSSWQVDRCRQGRPIGLGRPEEWASVIHPADLGTAVVAALTAPGGVYNVAAAPVRRADLMAGFAAAAGVERARFLPGWQQCLSGPRVESLARSHRVSTERLTAATGWTAAHPVFGPEWLMGSADQSDAAGRR